MNKKTLIVTLFLSTLSASLASVTFTQLFYHKGPYLDTFVLFMKEKDTQYTLERTAEKGIVVFNKSSLDTIQESLELLKTAKNYTLQLLQEEHACSLIVTPKNKTITYKAYSVVSDRFGKGIVLKIMHVDKKAAYFNAITSAKKPLRIFIDCGHGGSDPGARGVTGIYEKEITLIMGKKIAKVLEGQGYKVMLSRDSDTSVSLDGRTTAANNFKADLCLSLHADSCTRPEKSGISIRIPSQKIGLPLETGYEDTATEKSRILVSNNLAHTLLRTFSKELKTTPTIHADPFQMLLGTHMPTILIEMGFLSNKHDCQLLETDSYKDLCIKALKDGIKEFYR